MNSIVDYVQSMPFVQKQCCSEFALLGEPEAWYVS